MNKEDYFNLKRKVSINGFNFTTFLTKLHKHSLYVSLLEVCKTNITNDKQKRILF